MAIFVAAESRKVQKEAERPHPVADVVHRRYGTWVTMLNDTHALLVSLMRLGRGWYVRSEPSQPTQLLEMYEFEACPFCRKVREVLSELDLEYVSRTVARGSAGRDVLRARGGKMMVPYLIDPNTGTEMFESADIVEYLRETYG